MANTDKSTGGVGLGDGIVVASAPEVFEEASVLASDTFEISVVSFVPAPISGLQADTNSTDRKIKKRSGLRFFILGYLAKNRIFLNP
jgi:hypothetical protein